MRSASRILSLTALGLALLAGSLGMSSPGLAGDVPLPNPAKAFKGEQCLEPNDVMRRNHMDYLKHQRDETLREGIRGQKYSLNACIDCHAVTSPDISGGEVRTVTPFCAECHSYAAVSIDCFSCHTNAAVPGIRPQTALPTDHKAIIATLENHLGGKTVLGGANE